MFGIDAPAVQPLLLLGFEEVGLCTTAPFGAVADNVCFKSLAKLTLTTEMRRRPFLPRAKLNGSASKGDPLPPDDPC